MKMTYAPFTPQDREAVLYNLRYPASGMRQGEPLGPIALNIAERYEATVRSLELELESATSADRPTVEAMRETFRQLELLARWGRNLPDSDDIDTARLALRGLDLQAEVLAAL